MEFVAGALNASLIYNYCFQISGILNCYKQYKIMPHFRLKKNINVWAGLSQLLLWGLEYNVCCSCTVNIPLYPPSPSSLAGYLDILTVVFQRFCCLYKKIVWCCALFSYLSKTCDYTDECVVRTIALLEVCSRIIVTHYW